MQTSVATYSNINPVVFYGGGFCGGVDPRREQYAGEDVAGVEVPNYKTKYEALQNVIKDNYQLFEVDYYGVDNDNYVDGEGFCCEPQANTRKGRSLPTENVDYEKLQYYYHSDHLGSASYITNLDGEVVQHIEYVPFGEVFLEERNNTWNTPFLFNGKELDEETGLYYYGARYYNPRISLWYGVDPLAEKYPAHSPYCYTMNNPVMLIDPDGRKPTVKEAALIADHVYKARVGQTVGSWEVIRRIHNEDTGFQSALYRKSIGEDQYEYVYATAGTNPEEIGDLRTNYDQIASGKSEQYDESVKHAVEISGTYQNSEINYVGHSLGGGLASANALATGNEAITFNAAGLSDKTKSNLGLSSSAKIDAYVINGEIVDYSQSKIGLKAEGTIHRLEASYPQRVMSTKKNKYARRAEQLYLDAIWQKGVITERLNNHMMERVIEKTGSK